MAQFSGKYKLETNENFVPFLKSIGLTDDFASHADQVRPTLELTVDGDKFSFTSDSGVKNSDTTFTLGKEFDDALPNNKPTKSVATLSGNSITINSKAEDFGAGSRSYEFSGSGLVITYTSSKFSGEAKRIYKKL